MDHGRAEPVLGLRERKKRRTRATLMDAAVDLCARQGYDSTTVEQIAAIADVSPRTFSRYFTTKDAIVLALIDEILETVARELARQPREICHFEAIRRAYLGMAANSKRPTPGGLSSDRLLLIMRILISSGTLQHAAVEYRAHRVDAALAERMGTTVDDRRVKMISAVWSALLMTAMLELADNPATTAGFDVDDAVAAFEEIYADFMVETAGLGQPV
ncbi:TetR family transcriptional regulator [Mycolicibacterium chlorophenolicum]|uniref:HTH-type transcriptional regulator BetI n=1 Tax=Mycolicibacterium chlorophenolicum TaxID=37916 RepID=A0A0J6Y3N1_9MYCO|nr:HTH-type transcriptional regulator BetI [Mycolicibacterium chlorophenolicum]